MENDKQCYAFFLWFLASITVFASFYFLENYYRALQMLALFLLVSGYWLTRKGIYDIWDKKTEKKMWWQDNEYIRWDMLLHSVFFIAASLFLTNDIIYRPQIVQRGANPTLCLVFFFTFQLFSWLSGTAALKKAENGFLSPLSFPPNPPRSQRSRSYTEQVLRPVGSLWLAPTHRGIAK